MSTFHGSDDNVDTFSAARQVGLSFLESVKVLVDSDLSVQDAKRVAIVAEYGQDPDEHQERMASALTQLIDAAESDSTDVSQAAGGLTGLGWGLGPLGPDPARGR